MSSGKTALVAYKSVSDKLCKQYGIWSKSDKAKDGYIKDILELLLSVSKNQKLKLAPKSPLILRTREDGSTSRKNSFFFHLTQLFRKINKVVFLSPWNFKPTRASVANGKLSVVKSALYQRSTEVFVVYYTFLIIHDFSLVIQSQRHLSLERQHQHKEDILSTAFLGPLSVNTSHEKTTLLAENLPFSSSYPVLEVTKSFFCLSEANQKVISANKVYPFDYY